ncbi:transcription factor bHLH18-like [Prosopis cineraria]|uniref:transcription factor bHLH18-like n=1 Tax=Prosopis cineraria TaxID=364024 RepID=UPI00240EB0B5|nr:transcription factor bHLH18-like [Prosopis cineraria]
MTTWQNCFSDLDVEKTDSFNELFSINNSTIDPEDYDFLKDFIHQPPHFSSMSHTTHQSPLLESIAAVSNDSSASQPKHNSPSSIISGLSTISDKPPPEKHEPENKRASLKRTPPESRNSDPKANQRTRKTRSLSESLDHIMSERKRRQELTEKFIALSATIPGLKKIDKSSVLSEAINYVKKLQERVRELEKQKKKMSTELPSLSSMKKLHHHHHQDTTSSSETMTLGSESDHDDDDDDDECFRMNEALPEVEARVSQKEILIRIHCAKQNIVMLNILAELKSLHFSIISTSVLTFANSALDITIIAEVEEHKITLKELVEKLRLALLKTSGNQQ